MTQPNPPHQLPTWQPAQLPQPTHSGTGQQTYAQWAESGPTGSTATQATGYPQTSADIPPSQTWPTNPAPANTYSDVALPAKKRWWRSKVAIGVAGAVVVAGSFGLGFATHALVYGNSSNAPFTQDGTFPGGPNGGPGGGFGNQQGNGDSGTDEGGTGGSDGSNSSDSGTGTSTPVPQETTTDSTDA